VWGKGYHELIDLMAAHQAARQAAGAADAARRAAAREASLTRRLAAAEAEEGLAGAEAAALASAASGDAGGAAPAPALARGGSGSGGGGGVTPFGTSEVHLDVYGSGEDLEAIKAEAAGKRLDFTFYGGRDHADASMHDYQVCVC
jgi:hypothetical protein